jgi:AcrR family transcriptional regulator
VNVFTEIKKGPNERHGYEMTTLRDVARDAGVSVGLLYRYFPSKRAVIFALYDELSADYVAATSAMPAGRWRHRGIFALASSQPYSLLTAVFPSARAGGVRTGHRGRVGRAAAPARRRHRTPALPLTPRAASVVAARQDREPAATTALVALFEGILPSAAMTLRLPVVRRFVLSVDALVREALFASATLESPPKFGAK